MKRFRDGFRLFLGLAAAALILPACGSSSSGGVVNGPGVLQFLAAAVQVDEEVVGGTVELTVTRTGGSAGAVSVDYATAVGTAGAGDFTAIATTTLNWLDGEAIEKRFTVSITPDGTIEGSEFFSATLSNATGGATLGATTTAAVEILDVLDSPVSGILQFSAATFPTSEGVTVSVTVTRSGGDVGDITIDVDRTGGTATSATDYTDPGFPVTLSWATGVSGTQTVFIVIADDGPVPDAALVETIDLTLQNATSSGIPPGLGTNQIATVEITDDDAAGTVAFKDPTYSIGENGGSIDLLVTRVGTQGAASVDVTVTGGTAVAPGDYTFVSPFTVTWADGEQGDKPVNIIVTDDGATLGDVTAIFELANPSGVAIVGPTTTTLTIGDDETVPNDGEIVVTVSPSPVAESAAGPGQVTVTLTRQNGSSGPVNVTVSTANGTATSVASPAAKQDFVALVNSPLSWGAAELGAKTVTITIMNNDGTVGQTGDTFGGTENFTVNVTVTLGNPTVTGSGAAVSILDD